MLIVFTEFESKKVVAINPQKVVSVFTVEETDKEETKRYAGKTAIVLENGNVLVEEEYLEVVGRINGELNNSCCK
jgi:hypothetical protein